VISPTDSMINHHADTGKSIFNAARGFSRLGHFPGHLFDVQLSDIPDRDRADGGQYPVSVQAVFSLKRCSFFVLGNIRPVMFAKVIFIADRLPIQSSFFLRSLSSCSIRACRLSASFPEPVPAFSSCFISVITAATFFRVHPSDAQP